MGRRGSVMSFRGSCPIFCSSRQGCQMGSLCLSDPVSALLPPLCVLGGQRVGTAAVGSLAFGIPVGLGQREATAGAQRVGGKRGPANSPLLPPLQAPAQQWQPPSLGSVTASSLPHRPGVTRKSRTNPCWFSPALPLPLSIRDFIKLISITTFECAVGSLLGL